MAQWATFLGVVGVVVVLLLALTRASTAALDEEASTFQPASRSTGDGVSPDDQPTSDQSSTAEQPTSGQPTNERRPADALPVGGDQPTEPVGIDTSANHAPMQLSTLALLANVAVSQGVFAVLVVVMAWYTEIPTWAFGLATETLTVGAVGIGLAVGGGLYLGNEAAAALGRRQGLAVPTDLRESLAPGTAAGWVLLLAVVLPIIAGFEELLFRGALIGVAAAGTSLPPWLLVVGSSVAFALGHGAQGRFGIVVTGLLGVGLGAIFVLTGSLLVVVVAHYVVNVLEFIVHESG